MTTGPIGASLKYITINSNCDALTEHYSNGKNINIPIRSTTDCVGPMGNSIIDIKVNDCGDIDGYYSNNTIARFGKIIANSPTGLTGEQGPIFANISLGPTGPKGIIGPTGLPNSTINYVGYGFFPVTNDTSYTTAINELRQPNTYYPTYFGRGINCTNDTAVILSNYLYSSAQADYSVFIGGIPTEAIYYQDSNAVSIGGHTTLEQEGTDNIAIGDAAGESQYGNCIAIGYYAGKQHDFGSGKNSIAIGSYAASINQSDNSIALGKDTCYIAQNQYSIGIGSLSGYYLQDSYAIAIGNNTAYENQQSYSIAIGEYSGFSNLGLHSIGIGYDTCSDYSPHCINIGLSAGGNEQKESSIAIGEEAGQILQSAYSIGIGFLSGKISQGERCVAIGHTSGFNNQGSDCVALGYYCGGQYQGINSIAIGALVVQFQQSENSVAIGFRSVLSQETQSVFIGAQSGFEVNTQEPESTIIGFNSGLYNDKGSVIIGNNVSQPMFGVFQKSFFTIPNLTGISTGNGSTLLYDSNTGLIGPQVSSEKFKENIIPLSDNYTKNLSKLKVKRFNKNSIGLIAEEVVDYYPEIVNIDEQGKPHSINYTLLNVLLLKQLQILKQKIK